MATTCSEGASPRRTVRIHELKNCQTSEGFVAERNLKQSLGDETEVDVARVGGDLTADGVAVGIRLVVQVLVAAHAPYAYESVSGGGIRRKSHSRLEGHGRRPRPIAAGDSYRVSGL